MSFNSFPMGALTEISGFPGSGKTETVLKFLAGNPRLRVAWLEQDFSVYPCAFPQNQVDLRRVFFIDPLAGAALVNESSREKSPRADLNSGGSGASSAKTVLWAAHQILQSQLFGAVVLSVQFSERDAMIELRRLQLAAEKNRSAVILLADEPTCGASWPIQLRIQVSRSLESGEPSLTILRNKGRVTWQNRSA